ncbi:hypothetical protein [Cyanobium sp. Morenito 9A2]|nr:hypothetical protein [Cyanobium sp. Morenito 9A2]MCP9851086.1 hypothetical protein [Cyanobium sp. Morenito 9A2]
MHGAFDLSIGLPIQRQRDRQRLLELRRHQLETVHIAAQHVAKQPR